MLLKQYRKARDREMAQWARLITARARGPVEALSYSMGMDACVYPSNMGDQRQVEPRSLVASYLI